MDSKPAVECLNVIVGAVATADQVGRAGETFDGVPVNSGDVLVMYTYCGDGNLDGKINVDDYGRIDSSAPLGISGWYNGDFNYDGKINVDDYGIIDFNVGIQGSRFPTAGTPLGGVTAIPEPTLLVPPAALSLLSRRRRRPAQVSPNGRTARIGPGRDAPCGCEA